MNWLASYRADPAARAIADRHYNRQKVGAKHTLDALRRSLKPGSIEPRPRVWVHREGFKRRDAC